MLIDFEVVGTATKGILKKSDSGSMKKSSTLTTVERVNKHDLLIAEFKQVNFSFDFFIFVQSLKMP